jgi:four helix bundle protein
MSRPQYFEKLDVWQLSVGLIKQVHRLSDKLPKSEAHCLVDQLRRAAVSVALNIAEGRAADTDAEFRRFLGFSLRSVVEVAAAARICDELGLLEYRDVEQLRLLCDELEAKLRRFRQKLSGGLRRSGVKHDASSIERT